MAVAKSYEHYHIDCEPYADASGKMWVRVSGKCPRCGGSGSYSFNQQYGSVCFRCNGTGKETKEVRWYTDKERAKMDARAAITATKKETDRAAAAAYKRGPEANGFGNSEGYIDIILGDTYSIKEELKAAGCKYSPAIGWYIPYGVKYNSNHETYHLTWTAASTDGAIKSKEELHALIAASTISESISEYQGEVGSKITVNVTITRNIPIEGYYGLSHCHTMEDACGNVYVWITAAKDIPVNSHINITGTIKEHKEYKNVKQTILTRCHYKEVE